MFVGFDGGGSNQLQLSKTQMVEWFEHLPSKLHPASLSSDSTLGASERPTVEENFVHTHTPEVVYKYNFHILQVGPSVEKVVAKVLKLFGREDEKTQREMADRIHSTIDNTEESMVAPSKVFYIRAERVESVLAGLLQRLQSHDELARQNGDPYTLFVLNPENPFTSDSDDEDPSCTDFPHAITGGVWDDGKNGCAAYEKHAGWCEKYGGEDHHGEGSAQDACCWCGGGKRAPVFEGQTKAMYGYRSGWSEADIDTLLESESLVSELREAAEAMAKADSMIHSGGIDSIVTEDDEILPANPKPDMPTKNESGTDALEDHGSIFWYDVEALSEEWALEAMSAFEKLPETIDVTTEASDLVHGSLGMGSFLATVEQKKILTKEVLEYEGEQEFRRKMEATGGEEWKRSFSTSGCIVDTWVGQKWRLAWIDLSAGPFWWGQTVGGEGLRTEVSVPEVPSPEVCKTFSEYWALKDPALLSGDQQDQWQLNRCLPPPHSLHHR